MFSIDNMYKLKLRSVKTQEGGVGPHNIRIPSVIKRSTRTFLKTQFLLCSSGT